MFEPNTQEEQDSTQHQSFTKKLLGDDYVIKEQLPNEQQIASAQEKTNVVNLDEFASSLQHSSIFVNLLDTPNAFVAYISQLPTTTPIAPGGTRVKCKWSNMFSLVINVTNKNTKVVMGNDGSHKSHAT